MDDVLYQQLEQERLLNQVTTQIRQSLDLHVILSTAVEQLQQLLNADRLVIYQFDFRWSVPPGQCSLDEAHPEQRSDTDLEIPETLSETAQTTDQQWGYVTYEALASHHIPSVMHVSEAAACYVDTQVHRQKYTKGFTLVVDDVEETYTHSACLLKFLRGIQVKAKLVSSIVVQEELWGLLIAQQCEDTRNWQSHEVKFLSQVTEHLSIAIYQAQLYTQVQQQKENLELRVQERTQALQDALLAAQSASRAKSEFLATMSHELRTPLTCVIGISATLLRYLPDSSGTKKIPLEKQQSYLQTIHDSGEHLLELINDILDLSQVEAGKAVLQIDKFSLTKVLNQCLRFFREEAIQQQIDLMGNFQIDPAQDQFSADQRRLRQILFNLLSNAIKFTPAGGQVTLRAYVHENIATFQVQDTGIGIPESQQSLLFEKFQQLDSPYRRERDGTGLGLALTKQLVELHGGAIKFDSTEGEGSTFTVHLPNQPVVDKKSSGTTAKKSFGTFLPSIHSESTQCRLVIVENDEEIATLICELLTATGYQVVWLAKELTSIQQIALLQPAAVIVDLQVSGQGGQDMIRQLKQSQEIEDIKILALVNERLLSNSNGKSTIQSRRKKQLTKQLRTHFSDDLISLIDQWLTKPIKPNQLLEKIATLGL
ncbi:MAG: ATP-binding protein [Microcoleaceae cyanobacterium]